MFVVVNKSCSFVHVLLCYGSLGLRPSMVLCMLLLIVCGDIHPNPGPIVRTDTGINVCHANARSILKPGRLDELYEELCCLHAFDIIGISESHLSESVPDSDICIPNYTSFRRDRNRHGGGVLIYVHDRLSCIRRSDLEHPDLEIIWVEIKLGHCVFLVGVCYRPPNQNAEQIDTFMEGLHDSLYPITGHAKTSVVLLGDFNDRCTSWDSDHSKSELGLRLFRLIQSLNMFQIIDGPTRNENLLDLIITDSPAYFTEVDILSPFDNLDHSVISGLIMVTYPKEPKIKRKIWQYHLGNYDRLNNLLYLTDWDRFFLATDNINLLTERFTLLISELAESCIPTKFVVIRPRDKPGMNGEVRHLFKVAKRLHKRAKRTQNPVHIEVFRNARREAKSEFRRARSKFYSDISEHLLDPTTSSKTYWKLTKLVYGNKVVKGIPDLNNGASVVSDTLEKAKLLNKYFAEQCSLPPNSDADPLPVFHLLTQARLPFVETTPGEVRKILLGLNISKACGPDGISNRILRECANSICVPLSRLFNLSFRLGVFPSCWKKANVVPLYKKNDRCSVKNYRPVSLLCTMSKVLERIVHLRLYEHCVSNNLLTEKNAGFKQSDSTVNQLVSLTDKITKALDKKHDACVVFLDISKAFDKVWHRGLIFKLKQFGLGNIVVDWMDSYLSGRSQQVTINGVSSDPINISAGVPQGSILGPLLFLIYINDLVENLVCDPHLFADDTSLLDIFNNSAASSTRVNRDLACIHDWGTRWKVTFNPEKTDYLIISKKPTLVNYPDLFFNNTLLLRTVSHKHLGLTITHNLEWHDHIVNTIVKAERRIHMMKSVKSILPRGTLSNLYKTMVLPIIEYCDVIYDNCSLNLAMALEQVQRRAALVCTGAYRHTSNDLLLADLGWQPLRVRRQIHKLTLWFKIVNLFTPPYMRTLIPQPVENRYRLRSTSNAALPAPFCRLTSTQRGFAYSTINLWNSLDIGIRQCGSVGAFKRKIELLLFKEYNAKFLPRLYSLVPQSSASIQHCRLRLGLSGLNYHRFTYNFIPDKSCPNCGFHTEDLNHYLFFCPAYAAARAALMRDLSSHLSDNELLNATRLSVILLFGSNDFSLQTNLSIFAIFFKFIATTGRFQ